MESRRTIFWNRSDLTRREQEVEELVARGMTNIEIAEVIGVKPRSVHNYLRSIFLKRSVRNRVELATRHVMQKLEKSKHSGRTPKRRDFGKETGVPLRFTG